MLCFLHVCLCSWLDGFVLFTNVIFDTTYYMGVKLTPFWLCIITTFVVNYIYQTYHETILHFLKYL